MIALNKLRDSKFEKKLPKPRINSLKRAFVYCGAMAWNTMYTSNSCYRLEDTNLLWWEHGIHLRIMFQLKDTKFFQCLLKQQPQFSAWSVFYYYNCVVPENIQTPTTEGISLEGKPSSIYCFPIAWCDVMHDGRINVWWNRHHFSENSIKNMPHVQPQN